MSDRARDWDAERVRALRERLGMTQRQLADEIGVRQQTVSEWETGIYQPRGASARMLRVVAERAAPYEVRGAECDVRRVSPDDDIPSNPATTSDT